MSILSSWSLFCFPLFPLSHLQSFNVNSLSISSIIFCLRTCIFKQLGGNKFTQGLTVAAFSLGRVASSPYLGAWSETKGSAHILSLASLVVIAGTLLNAYAPSCEFLIGAQVLTGVGSGTLGVTRSYVTERTFGSEKTWKLARLTAVQYAGFTVTPFLGAFYAHVMGDAAFWVGPIWVTSFTLASYSLTAIAVVLFVCLQTVFVDYVPVRDRPKKPAKPVAAAAEAAAAEAAAAPNASTSVQVAAAAAELNGASNGDNTKKLWSEVDWCLFAGLALNVATKGSVGVFETVGVPVAKHRFGVSAAVAGYSVSGCGALGTALLAYGMKPLSAKHSDALLMAVGVAIMAISCTLLMSPSTSSAVYLAAIFAMYATGYPLGHTAVLTWFSKLTTQSSQGSLQGWFASAGSFGRIVLPAVAGLVAEYEGFVSLFTALGGFLVLTVLVIGLNYARFVRLAT